MIYSENRYHPHPVEGRLFGIMPGLITEFAGGHEER
jgi:hypothetical protein